jgi:hypothetical protein
MLIHDVRITTPYPEFCNRREVRSFTFTYAYLLHAYIKSHLTLLDLGAPNGSAKRPDASWNNSERTIEET